MAFVRRRGNSHSLVESYRAGGRVRQRLIANLGPYPSVQAAIEADPEKFGHLAHSVVSPVVSESSLRRGQPAEIERRVQVLVNERIAALNRRLDAAENEARRLREENDRLRRQQGARQQAQEPVKERKWKQRGET